ncbi:Murein DD-endopeptidase MepM [compost metagenome]
MDITGTGHGSPIYAANNGVITEATSHYSYGNYIVVNHNNGYYSLYAHMSRLNVKVGQVVGRGSVIGYMGSTGHSTGTHLHFEIWKGKPMGGGYRINPYTVY